MTSLNTIHRGISRSGVVHAPYEQSLFEELDGAIDFYRNRPDALIQILHRAQELFGYLREDVLVFAANRLRLPVSQVHGVIGFYSFFSKVPQGKHTVRICTGTACYVQGADQLLRSFEKQLGVRPGETTSDGRYSLRCARCVGACGLAPVAMINDDVQGNIKPGEVKKVLRKYR